jgi:ATP-dependent DNA helicase Q4
LSGQSGSSEKTVLKTKKRCPGHEVSFSIAETVEALDLPQENITTLLCYLELDEGRKWVQILPHTYQTCKIHSYGGAKLLKASALKVLGIFIFMTFCSYGGS